MRPCSWSETDAAWTTATALCDGPPPSAQPAEQPQRGDRDEQHAADHDGDLDDGTAAEVRATRRRCVAEGPVVGVMTRPVHRAFAVRAGGNVWYAELRSVNIRTATVTVPTGPGHV